MIDSNILIVDDDEVDRKIVCRTLAQLEWTGKIFQAATALEAHQLADEHYLGCILLDYQLPSTDGLDLLIELHDKFGAKVPIIMLTGLGNEMVAVEAMKRGASDYLPKSLLTPDSLFRIISNTLEKSRLELELAEARSQLEFQALHDTLTSLGNRSLLMHDLNHVIARAKRNNGCFCVFMMDLDKFKAANDSYGHEAGDAILAEIGQRLIATGRNDDIYYRLGGDEFIALIDNTDRNTALFIAERIKKAIATPIDWHGIELSVGVSIGIASYPDDGDNSETLLRTADSAMYEAKHSGLGIVSVTKTE